MEVNASGQGRQSAFDYDKQNSSIDSQNIMQNNNSSNDINLENRTSQTDAYGKVNLQQRQVTEKEVKTAADKLNKLFEGKDTHVEYEFIGKSRTMSVKIIDDKTKDVIKEIPPKKIIEMIDKLCELAGIMVDEKA